MICRHAIQFTGMIFCWLALLASDVALAAAPKRVLILHSFSREVKPWKEMSTEIHAELARQSPWPLDIIDHSVVTARNEADKSEARFVDYLDALFEKEPIDLVLSIGAPAAVFVQRHRQKLFPATPMVIAALEQRRIQPSFLTENDTVAGVAADFPSIITNILQVLPETRTVAVVMGDSPNERYWLDVLRTEYASFAGRVSFVWLNNMSFEDILTKAAALPPHSAIFFFLMNVDATGVSFEGDTALRRLHAVANAPIFTHDDTYFADRGIVGGPMHSFVNTSRHAVAVALRVLGGERPADIRVPPVQFASPKFDWNEMKRWGISESNLPAGSKVYFREATVWERYSWQITMIVAAMLLQAGLIAGLIYEHRRRQLAEVQARQRMAELAHVNRFTTAGELTATIAHEINQPLGTILANAEAAQFMLKSRSPDIAELSEIVGDIVREDRRAGEVIRRIRSLLSKAPFELQSLDLNAIVRETVDLISPVAVARTVKLAILTTPDALPVSGDSIQLQQAIQNLLLNGADAMKDTPAESRILGLQTTRAGNFAELSVSDRGPGIPGDKLEEVFEPFFTSKAGGMGMGLSIARRIIEAHGGFISAENQDHGGASFRIRLPLLKGNWFKQTGTPEGGVGV